MRGIDSSVTESHLHPILWVGLGIGIGVAASALLDPHRGAARRAMIRDKTLSFGREMVADARGNARNIAQRAKGAVHETKARFTEGDVPNEVLEERVRAQIGRAVSRPGALQVQAKAGCIEVRGAILADEVDELLTTIRHVRGVTEVIDHLEIHRTPENVPSLQGLARGQA